MRLRHYMFPAWIAGVIFATVPSMAATVSGKVTLHVGVPAENAVIAIQGNEKSTPLSGAMVDQRNRTFLPHVSVVTQGTTVRFPNDDNVFHNVFAYYRAKRFDLGMYPRGASKTVTFDKTGIVAILCNVHSTMSAYIMVVDTPYYAVADSRGMYRIKNITPGKYTLHVWHESGAGKSQEITVDPHDATIDLDLGHR